MTTSVSSIFQNARDRLSFAAGEVIFSQGDPGDFLYIVVDGEVEILHGSRTIELVGPGGLVGEMALIDSRPRSATAQAKTRCTLARVDEKQFTYLIQQAPYFALQVMRVMAERLRQRMQD